MIRFPFSLIAITHSPSRHTAWQQDSTRRCRIERLEPRCLLSGSGSADLWSSLVFDDGVDGSLGFDFSRNIATVDGNGNAVGIDEARYGNARLLTDINSWSQVMNDVGGFQLLGSGWDLEGQNPLAVLWNPGQCILTFLRGTDFEVVNTVQINVHGGDLLSGEVEGYRYAPQHAIVYEGLVVFATQRERFDQGDWIVEGVTLAWTQDYGQTFTRVAQAGGGFDVPPIAGGVTDGMNRLEEWSFSNAYPEKPDGGLLGAWFPWADYLRKTGNPQGGQIGLFRARRTAVGQTWVVEPNVVVYENWEANDEGGLHAHSAGMFVDGLASFWGDQGYRNHMVRHIADDLENYTTTTWTHKEDFHGAWSPDDARVYDFGNQAASTAPGQVFGEILAAGDEQPELVMKIQAPEDADGKAIITNLRGSFTGVNLAKSLKVPRLSIWIHYMPDVGYLLRERSSRRIGGTDAFYFSVDGESWGSVLNLGTESPYLFGDQMITIVDDGLFASQLPDVVEERSPLLLSPGGTNLAEADWTELVAPATGNQLLRVNYTDGLYTYADSGLPLDVQPNSPPPVAEGMPLWEVITVGNDVSLGKWELTSEETDGNQVHWLSSWHYSLDGDGVSPEARLGSDATSGLLSTWVTNNQWVPTLTYGTPDKESLAPAVQSVEFTDGTWPAERRWLMALEGYTVDAAPSYPLPPATTGPNELATVASNITSETWTVGLTFGLPQVSSFSSHFDPLGSGTVHTIASLRESFGNYIDVSFVQTAKSEGMIAVDVYENDILRDRLTFSSVVFDREDQVRLLLSDSPDEFGVTLLVTRDGYGVASKAVAKSGTLVSPKQILLSDANQSSISSMEWYAVQVNATEALSTAEREAFIVSAGMIANNDGSAQSTTRSADFDRDGDVDGTDFMTWQRSAGMQFRAEFSLGDSDGDQDIDSDDLSTWASQYSDRLPGDFDLDLDVDGSDFLVWQRNFGATGAEFADGDADEDGDVDVDDLQLWETSYGKHGGIMPSGLVGNEDVAQPLLAELQSGDADTQEELIAPEANSSLVDSLASNESLDSPSSNAQEPLLANDLALIDSYVPLSLSPVASSSASSGVREESPAQLRVLPQDQAEDVNYGLLSEESELGRATDKAKLGRSATGDDNSKSEIATDHLFTRLGEDDDWVSPLRSPLSTMAV